MGETDDADLLARAASTRGRLELELGNLDRARTAFEVARAHVAAQEGHGPPRDESFAVRLDLVRWQAARRDATALRRALQELPGAPDDPRHRAARAEVLARLGLVLWRASRAEGGSMEAATLLKDALTRLADDQDVRVDVQLALADVELRAQRFDQAAVHLTGAREDAQRHAGLRTSQRHDLDVEALAARLERTRGRPAAEHWSALQARLPILRSAVREQSSMQPRQARVPALESDGTRALLGELIQAAVAVGTQDAERTAFELVLELAVYAPLERDLGASAQTLATVRRDLLRADTGHGILRYVAGEDSTWLFLATTEHLRCTEVERPDVLATLCARTDATLRRAPRSASDRQLARTLLTGLLRALLPADVLPAVLGLERLTIVGADFDGAVPFGALLLADGRTLGTELELTRVSSLAAALALDARARAPLALAAGTCAVLGAPQSTGEFAPLPLDADRLARLLEGWPRERVHAFAGADFTTARLTEQLCAADVLQIVTTIGRDDARLEPGILLTSDGLTAGFGATEIEACPAPRLVVQTIALSQAADVDPARLAPFWLQAGARAVLLTTRELELEPLCRVSELVHRELARGASPAAALLRARQRLARTPGFEEPWHLAGWTVIGAGHAPLVAPPPPRGRARFTIGALILALAIGSWLLRRRRSRCRCG